jgi:tRNA A-37 threonylcarbamoyl transferase component Bud32
MELTTFEAFRKTTNKLYILIDDSGKYLVKNYYGLDGFARYQQEKFMINHWRQAGFMVPQIYDRQVPDVPEPYLVTGFIEGPSLREYLSSKNRAMPEKLVVLAKFFEQMRRRHDTAIQTDDRYLIHYDPSSGNVLYTGDNFYFIDFESFPKGKHAIPESASIELATLCRWIVRDLGPEFLEEVLKVMVTAYKGQEPLLNLVVERTTSRSFQFYHRWKNKKRKFAHPDEITKYDIADALAKLERSFSITDNSNS